MARTSYSKEVAALCKANNIKPSHKKKPTPKRTLGQDSQRAAVSKSGKVTKKPSARLLARRQKDTIPGYYPNPVEVGKQLRELSKAVSAAQVALGEKSASAQARLSYAQGMLDMAFSCGIITKITHDREIAEFAIYANIKK